MPEKIVRTADGQSAKRVSSTKVAPILDAGRSNSALDTGAKFLTPVEASKYLWEAHGIQRSVPTLASYRVRGGGPRYRKDGDSRNGAVTYPPEELDVYALGRLHVRTSTAEV